MALQPFTWGSGGQKITSPKQAEAQRRIAEALAKGNPAKNWAEGLANATGAWAGQAIEDRVAQAEAEGQQRAGGLFSSLAMNSSPDAIVQALTSPDAAWASDAQTSIASALLNQGMERQDPMYQLQLEQAQLELENLRNPTQANPYMNVGGGSVFNQATGEFMSDPNAATDPNVPADIQEYQWYADAETVAGRVPLSYLDFVNAQKGGGLSVQTNPDGTTTITQGGPGKPMTEGQSKDTVYSTRARGALPTIDALETELLSLSDQMAGNVPLVGNYMQSESYQTARTAGKEFLAAILRKDTGAAVTDTEEKNYGDVYLPRPGDKPSVIAYKRQARARALAAIEAGMPPQGLLAQEQALRSSGGTEPASGTSPQVIDWTEL